MAAVNRSIRTLVILGLVAAILLPFAVQRITCAAGEDQSSAARERLAQISGQDQLSELFNTVANAVMPAVVEIRVVAYQRQPAQPDPYDLFRHFFGDDDPFGRGLPRRRQQRPPVERRIEGLGSGVIIDAEAGYVLTNAHVVDGAQEVEVVLSDGRKFDAQWVRSDPLPFTDLAVIKISTDGLVEAPLGDSDSVKVGHWVLAIGSPRGLDQTVTAGIISAKGRKTGLSPYQRFLQTDAAINRGNSGGPLVNMRGEVIGINSAISSFSGGNEGIGFAIPSNLAKEVLAKLIESDTIVRGFLGILPQDVVASLAESLELPGTKGCLVAQVIPDSPAEKAGIQVGDFIVEIAGKKITSEYELRRVVAAIDPDSEVEFKLYRNGKKKKLDVKIGTKSALAAGKTKSPERAEKAWEGFGLKLQGLPPEIAERLGYPQTLKGVLIMAVDTHSDAYRQGIRQGMVITHVRNIPVTGLDEVLEAMSDAGTGLSLRIIKRGGLSRFLFIKPMDK